MPWHMDSAVFSRVHLTVFTALTMTFDANALLCQINAPVICLAQVMMYLQPRPITHTYMHRNHQKLRTHTPCPHLTIYTTVLHRSCDAGPLAIADDLQIFEVTADTVVQKTLYVPDRSAGWIFLPRTATVTSLGTELKVFGSNAGRGNLQRVVSNHEPEEL